MFLKNVAGHYKITGANQGVFKYEVTSEGKKRIVPYTDTYADYVKTSELKSYSDLGEYDYDLFANMIKKQEEEGK